MSHIESRVTEVENSCSFINDTHEKHACDLRKAQSEVKSLESTINTLSTEKDQLKSKVIDLGSRSMRENPMFYGINEKKFEDCKAKIKNFCRDKLDLDASMICDHVYRVGVVTPRKL